MPSVFVSSLCPFALIAALAVAGSSPGWAQDTAGRSTWSHNGSTMYLVAAGTKREFYYQQPRPGMLQAGAHEGAILFSGESIDGRYLGTAYIYDSRCGKFPYPVSGPILDNSERVMLTGKAPRVGRDCRVREYRSDTLEFRLVSPEEMLSKDSLPADFAGIWIEAAAQKNVCTSGDWEKRGSADGEYDYFTRLMKVSGRALTGWELECDIKSSRRTKPNSEDQVEVEAELSCVGESLSWRSKQLWNVQTIDSRKHLVVTTLKTSNMRDDSGKPFVSESSGPRVSRFFQCK